jgi:hypothetical protein
MNAIPNSWIRQIRLASAFFCLLLACSGCAMYFETEGDEREEALRDHPAPQFATPGPYFVQQGTYGSWSWKP